MVDGERGWATGANLVLRTADGGASWRDVTPAGCRSSATSDINSTAVLDAATLWFVCQQGATAGSQPTFALFRTRDGGQGWHTMPLQLQPGISVGGLTFVDANDGWLADEQGSATGHHFLTLYGSTDGGVTWHEVTRTDQPNSLASGALGGGPVFLSATTGWFGSDLGDYTTVPDQFAVWVTRDGGATWSQQALPPPDGQVVGPTAPPTCFDARHCVIILEPSAAPSSGASGPAQRYLLRYVSDDSGQTWAADPLVPVQVGSVAFLDPLDGWGVVDPNPPGVSACDASASSLQGLGGAHAASPPLPNVLEGTTDGGQHWTALNRTVNWCDLEALDFVSPQHGWALSGAAGAATTLWQTTDGGVSWAESPWRSA
jgi:photosystem II stability/assembly factor-like uncharacterized protein